MMRTRASALLPTLVAAACLAAEGKGTEEPPWRVEDPHGPFHTISFTTDEGTWLALDVHPHGDRIVFSLLGDLYLLPIGGGEARRITSGPAYDVQPRFSPDGTRIAFASDRGGLENLWICDLDGTNARQVSTEKESTVSSPAWSEDGAYLVGRKRITDVSAIGTVELWMWHLKGGDGVQVTKKDDQPDAADPVFSKDGRFIYYSARDARYEYDRNVYQGIWQIKRFDRRTGQSVPVTGEEGGAACPALSPDGRTMALVRRVAARTVLEVLDLDSGKLRLVASGLTRDNQEGFCFHGTFPGFAFTPDGREIVATADGKIWRYDVEKGDRAPLPFSAAVEQRVTDALRFPQDLHEDAVRARIIRWPVQSPDGKLLVFSALGHLHAMDLPSGTPRRLTKSGALEYAPAFSRDGSQIVFTTWSDDAQGYVATLPASGGEPKRITTVPGQYVNPSFSADGRRIVFVKGSGASLRDHDLADELWLEIFWASADGGESHYVIGTETRDSGRRVTRPTFSADGSRIFYVEDEKSDKPFDPPKGLLVSVSLDGTDRQVHARFPEAEEALPSPDGRWIAFSEDGNAFVTALPRAGNAPVDVGGEKPALPLGQLSEEGGEWMGWAAGGSMVTWISGTTFHRAALADAIPEPAPANAGEKARKTVGTVPRSEPVEIRLSAPCPRPEAVVAYVGARVVTMRADEVIDDGTIVVKGDRIGAVGRSGSVAVPAGAAVVDLAGSTVVPGMLDEHAHLHYADLDVFPQRQWRYLANLAYGVTSVHDPSASTQEVFTQKEMVEAGLMVGPRIFSTGYVLYGAEGPGRAAIENLDDARHHVRRLKTAGAFSVKSYMQPRREQRQWILQAAREERMMVVPEGGGDLEMDMTFVLDGHTTNEHSLPMAPLYKDVVTLVAKSQTSYTPTLLVAYGGLSGEHWFYQHAEVFKDEKLRRYVPPGLLDARARIRTIMAPDDEWHHIDVAASAKKIADAGGRVCLGAHGQLQGLGAHWELWALVQGGMSPLQALRAATLAPAETLGLDGDIGSLEPGKLADFVVMAKNPLEKIENSDSVTLVVKGGVAFRPEDLVRR